MDSQVYAQELNSFAFNFNKTAIDYISIETKERVVISKLYYALLHHYFMKYPYISTSTGGQKHETILRILEKENNREYRLFSTLKRLREWADYYPLNNPPFSLNLANLFHQVNRLVH